jgi:hypothetical protein
MTSVILPKLLARNGNDSHERFTFTSAASEGYS